MKPLMAALLCVLMAGCAAPTGIPTTSPNVPPSASTGQVAMTVTDGMFRLTAHADQATYHAGDAIGMQAIVTYLGPAPSFAAYGSGPTSGGGLVAFDVQQLDGSLHPRDLAGRLRPPTAVGGQRAPGLPLRQERCLRPERPI